MNNGQRSLTYTTIHLNHRNEVLLKSVVALYNMRSRTQWRRGEGLSADLIVVGDEIDQAELDQNFLAKIRPSQVVLSLGSRIRATSDRMLYVEPPLRAGEVVKCLEQAENYLLRIRQESANRTDFAEENGDDRLLHDKIKLIRWPGAELLREHWDYIRLATMMTHRAMTVTELTERSMQSQAICRHFIVEALRTGCAEYVAKEDAKKTKPPAAQGLKGLLTKIRTRLGLFNSEVHS